jgi:hypothetical protein
MRLVRSSLGVDGIASFGRVRPVAAVPAGEARTFEPSP